MLVDVDSVEKCLLNSCDRLEHGVLYPVEAVPEESLSFTVDVHTSQFKLIEWVRRLGLPHEITVADGLPQWAVFEVKLDAGIGRKRIKLN